MTMRQTPCALAPRIAARLRHAVRLGHLPKLARAEGRDPRFLTIMLRGALDGLATVAPVGDPDWVALRGDNALTLDGKTPALKLDDFFALNPAMPNLHRHVPGQRGDHRPRLRHALSRALAFRRPGRARKRPAKPGRATAAGSIARCKPGRRAAASIPGAARPLRSGR
jgi:hypothetical protein